MHAPFRTLLSSAHPNTLSRFYFNPDDLRHTPFVPLGRWFSDIAPRVSDYRHTCGMGIQGSHE